jgi:hypothetical protein
MFFTRATKFVRNLVRNLGLWRYKLCLYRAKTLVKKEVGARGRNRTITVTDCFILIFYVRLAAIVRNVVRNCGYEA